MPLEGADLKREKERERLGLPFENSVAFASDDFGRPGLLAVLGLDDNFLVSRHDKEECLAECIKYKANNYTLKGGIIIRF